MNFREAIICLDEYSVSIANFSGMLKPIIAQGELGEALRKVNDALMEKLKDRVKESTILSILVNEELIENREQMADLPAEWADVLEALTRVKLASNTATEVEAEYRRQAEAANKEKERGAGVSEGIQRFLRSAGLMSDEEAREEMNMWAKKAELASNTADQLEICAAAETVAPGSEAEAEIRTESLESPAQVPTIPAKNAAREQICTDDTEDLLNWVAGLDRTGVIAVLSSQAEAVQQSVQRFASQPAKLREAKDRVDWVNRILLFFRDGNIAPGMTEHELSLCRSFEEKMPVRGPS